jgi:DNA polymerase IIIc chi subunit
VDLARRRVSAPRHRARRQWRAAAHLADRRRRQPQPAPRCGFSSTARPTTSLDGLERAVYLFDGRDPDALDSARARWTQAREAGYEVTYWQQDEDGRWVKRA